jgi:DNA-binding MarR family transcriptional regulator
VFVGILVIILTTYNLNNIQIISLTQNQTSLSPSTVIMGNSDNLAIGYSVSGLGDINKDGFNDFMIGSSNKTYLIFGSGNEFENETIAISSVANTTFLDDSLSNRFGSAVASAGDVNNDGYDDFMVSDFMYQPSHDGRVYVFLGKHTNQWQNEINTSLVEWMFVAESSEDRFGKSIAGVGDVNNDGYDDMLIGAPKIGGGEFAAGKSYLFFGEEWIGWAYSGSHVNVSFMGEVDGDYAGISVAGAGDVNSDGYPDFLIGAHKHDDQSGSTLKSNSGKTYLIFGRPNNKWSQNFNLSDADSSFVGEASSDYSGFSCAGVGDVNGDDYEDFLIGAPDFDFSKDNLNPLFDNSGRVYLIFGKETSLWDNQVNLDQADVIISGESSGSRAGYSLKGVGDVNEDGYDDFLIGAPGYDHHRGKAVLIFGRENSNWKTHYLLNETGLEFKGESRGDFLGYSLGNLGDFNADGLTDFIIGAFNNSLGGTGKANLIELDTDPIPSFSDETPSGVGKVYIFSKNLTNINVLQLENLGLSKNFFFLDVSFVQLLTLSVLSGITIILGFGYYTLKIKRSPKILQKLQAKSFSDVKFFYEKVIVASQKTVNHLTSLNIPKTSVLDESKIYDLTLENSISHHTISDFFSQDMHKEIQVEIKGRIILVLVEIAFQGPDKANTVFIGKLLDISRQTVSGDINRLLKLNYIEPHVTSQTLQDTRFKYYSLTYKGLTFLQMLKESISLTLMEIDKRN